MLSSRLIGYNRNRQREPTQTMTAESASVCVLINRLCGVSARSRNFRVASRRRRRRRRRVRQAFILEGGSDAAQC